MRSIYYFFSVTTQINLYIISEYECIESTNDRKNKEWHTSVYMNEILQNIINCFNYNITGI